MGMELDSYRKLAPNVELAKRLKLLVWIVSALVLGLVAAMRPIRPWFLSLLEKPEGLSLPFLPPFHAALNAFAAFGLVMAVRAIKKRRASGINRFPRIHTLSRCDQVSPPLSVMKPE